MCVSSAWAISLPEHALRLQSLADSLETDGSREGFQQKADALAQYFFEHIDNQVSLHAMKSWSDQEILVVYDGLLALEFWSSKVYATDVALGKYALVFEELEKRKIATNKQAHYLFTALLSNGKWDEAREILRRWPSLSSEWIPQIVGAVDLSDAALGYYVVSADLKTMSLKQFDRNRGPRIIISGFCHFADDFIRKLSSQAEFSQIMAQYGIVINPNDLSEFGFKKMDSLRKEFPAFEFHPVISSGAWFTGGVNTLVSPSVVFLLNGQEAYRSIFGANQDSIVEFCKGLKSIGLSAPHACER